MKLAALIAIAHLAAGIHYNPAHASGPAYRASLPAIPAPPQYSISEAPCPAYGGDSGCTYPDGRIYLGGDHDSFTRFHELGHAYDDEVMTDQDRAKIMPLLNRHARQWACGVLPTDPTYGDDGCPLERFADAYATCSLREDPNGTTPFTSSNYGYNPNRARHYRVCWMISSFGVTSRN